MITSQIRQIMFNEKESLIITFKVSRRDGSNFLKTEVMSFLFLIFFHRGKH